MNYRVRDPEELELERRRDALLALKRKLDLKRQIDELERDLGGSPAPRNHGHEMPVAMIDLRDIFQA